MYIAGASLAQSTCLARSPPPLGRHGYDRCSICRCLRTERRAGKVSPPVIHPSPLRIVLPMRANVVVACWCHVVWRLPPSLPYLLPRGAFSVVRKCVKMTTGDQFAAKIISITKLSQKGEAGVLKRCERHIADRVQSLGIPTIGAVSHHLSTRYV